MVLLVQFTESYETSDLGWYIPIPVTKLETCMPVETEVWVEDSVVVYVGARVLDS